MKEVFPGRGWSWQDLRRDEQEEFNRPSWGLLYARPGKVTGNPDLIPVFSE